MATPEELDAWVEAGLITDPQRKAILKSGPSGSLPPPPSQAQPHPAVEPRQDAWRRRLHWPRKPFGAFDIAPLVRPLMGFLAALGVGAVLVALDTWVQSMGLLAGVSNPVTTWATIPIVVAVGVNGLLRSRNRDTWLAAAWALLALFAYINPGRDPALFVPTVLAVFLLQLCTMTPHMRVAGTLLAIPILLEVLSHIPGPRLLSQVAAVTVELLLLWVSLPARSAWRNIPFWGLTAVGAVCVAASFLGIATTGGLGVSALPSLEALVASLVLLAILRRVALSPWGAQVYWRMPLKLADGKPETPAKS